MATVSRSIAVEKDRQLVWDYLADWRHTEEWDPPTVRTTLDSGDGGVGTVYQNTSKMLGVEADVEYTVTEFDPPRRLQLRGENASLTATDTIELEGEAEVTTVTYTAVFEPKGAAKLSEPLLPAALNKLADSVEDSLREHLRAL